MLRSTAHMRISETTSKSMALINRNTKEIHCKIVYYGMPMSGKTSSLQYLHTHLDTNDRGDLLSIATPTERSLFFDFFLDPPDILRGFRVRWHLYTVPGVTLDARRRTNVLQGVDGVVFVVDSKPHYLQENWKSLQEVARYLASQDKTLINTPLVIQYNKRDLPESLPIHTLNSALNPAAWPHFETVAWPIPVTIISTDMTLACFHTIRTLVLKKVVNPTVDDQASRPMTTWQEVAAQFTHAVYLALPLHRRLNAWLAYPEYYPWLNWVYSVLLPIVFGILVLCCLISVLILSR